MQNIKIVYIFNYMVFLFANELSSGLEENGFNKVIEQLEKSKNHQFFIVSLAEETIKAHPPKYIPNPFADIK